MAVMQTGARRSSPRPERVALWLCLATLVGLSWLYLLLMDVEMRAMAGTRPSLGLMGLMPMGAWGIGETLLALAMWVIMMVAMMVPSALPVILLYDKVQRRSRPQAATAATACFVTGYLTAWAAFSVLATALQYLLVRLGLFGDFMTSGNAWLRGVLLLLAGAYQFTPWKHACLKQCQSPLGFISRNWRDGRIGALRMGLGHGIYCLGCCWLLMAVLFAVGVMNLLWIVLLSGAVLVEKLVARRRFSYLLGIVLIGLGVHEMVLAAVR